MAKKNNLYINIKDDDAQLAMLADFLRDGEISSRSLMALSAFYMSLSIARSSTSTREEIRKAEHHCLSLLKQQMIYIMDEHYREDGIKMNADEFSSVSINQSLLSQFPNFDRVIPQDVGEVSRNENREVPAAPLPSSIAEHPVIPIVETPIEEEDEDYDPYENMTDEEYLAATDGLVERPVMKS